MSFCWLPCGSAGPEDVLSRSWKVFPIFKQHNNHTPGFMSSKPLHVMNKSYWVLLEHSKLLGLTVVKRKRIIIMSRLLCKNNFSAKKCYLAYHKDKIKHIIPTSAAECNQCNQLSVWMLRIASTSTNAVSYASSDHMLTAAIQIWVSPCIDGFILCMHPHEKHRKNVGKLTHLSGIHPQVLQTSDSFQRLHCFSLSWYSAYQSREG